MELLLLYLVVYLGIGAIAGTLSGLLGIGGGILIVPALNWVYHWQGMSPSITMHLAAGTSLASMVVSAFSSLRHHLRHGIAVWPAYRRLAPGVMVGTMLGALLADVLHSRLLVIVFGLFLLGIAAMMFLNTQPKPQRQLPGALGMNGVGLLIGVKSGLLGLGGGVITIPFLTYCNVAMRNAVGISIACSLTVAIIGTIGFMLTGHNAANLPHWSTGYVYWPAVLTIALASPIAAKLGTCWSHRLPVGTLKKLFAVFLLGIALQMLLN